jgi:hypothetical protein
MALKMENARCLPDDPTPDRPLISRETISRLSSCCFSRYARQAWMAWSPIFLLNASPARAMVFKRRIPFEMKTSIAPDS